MNKFDEMREAVCEAEHTLRAADDVAASMARLLVGRLRFAGTDALRKLKKELREFDMVTGEWK
jgi:hypothetical protein